MKIMSLGLTAMSHMSIFNDFDETDDKYHGRIIDQFTMITVDSTPADNHESTLGTGTNDLGNDTRAHNNLILWSSRGSLWNCLAIPLILVTLLPNISGSNCDHIYSVEDELLSNCDTKESVEDETNSNCDTKEKVEDETNSNCDTSMVEDECIRMGENSNHWVLRMNFVT